MDIKTWLLYGTRLDEYTFCATIWWIWRDRNNSIFNQDDEWSSLKVKSLALSLTKELKLFYHMQPASVPLFLLVDWTPPLGSTVKINCDASVYNVSHVTGFGCVIRDELVLIQRTANVAADFLAKSAVDKSIGYVELLEPLNGMHNVLDGVHHSSAVKS
ncbi:hypothetical protein PIB30_072899 [Stylosanthes scabra]|uniref:RNase H type-1 domain-containing protein n=1 Tax=Stylosanthes scabra TaxID=79078 RepID=A0ABU6ZMY5_9FABA|nr:hypothetical protein [Stylosanthes scabra]